MWVDFNVNHLVRVKLTEEGRKALRLEHFRLMGPHFPYEPPTEDADGWSEWQLWDLAHRLGSAMFNGCRVPFETLIQIEVNDEKLAGVR